MEWLLGYTWSISIVYISQMKCILIVDPIRVCAISVIPWPTKIFYQTSEITHIIITSVSKSSIDAEAINIYSFPSIRIDV